MLCRKTGEHYRLAEGSSSAFDAKRKDGQCEHAWKARKGQTWAGALADVWNVLLLAFREENWKDSMAVWGGAEGEEWSVFHRDLVCERKIWKGHAYRSMDKTLRAGVQHSQQYTLTQNFPKYKHFTWKETQKLQRAEKKSGVIDSGVSSMKLQCVLGSRESSCLCHQLNRTSFLYACC